MKYQIESEIRKDGSRIYYDIYVSSHRPTEKPISPPHIHTYYELVYPTGGDMEFMFGEEICRLKEHDIIMVPPNVVHGTQIPIQDPETFVSMHVTKFSTLFLYPQNPVPSDIQYLLPPLQFEKPYAIIRHGTPIHREMFRLLSQIYEEAQESQPGYEIAMRAYCALLYTNLLRRMAKQEDIQTVLTEAESSNADIICRALTYIEEHYQEPISMQQVASEYNVNYYYFSRIFKQYTHQGFRDYVMNFRVNMARKMLLQTNDSITSIALNCGFETISYFIKKFQEVTGMTPKNFRKQYINIPYRPADARGNYSQMLKQADAQEEQEDSESFKSFK